MEERRLARFEYDETRLIALGKFLEADIKDAVADENTYSRRVTDLSNDLTDYAEVISDKAE